jgi:chromate transporter
MGVLEAVMQDDDNNILLTLFLVFAPFSLTAFGGGVSVLSAIQYQVVDVYHWLTGDEFLALFAISRAAPGPGSMLATLIGWEVAGLSGAAVATLAMFVPSSLLCVLVAAMWHRFRAKAFMAKLERAVAPIGAGLMAAGIVSIGELVSVGPALILISVAASILCMAIPSIHPLIVIGLGAVANVSLLLM